MAAVLTISKTRQTPTVVAGQLVTYSVVFGGTGTLAAGSTITDTLPLGTTFVGADISNAPGWVITMTPSVGGSGVFQISNPLPIILTSPTQFSFQLTVKVNSDATGTITNNAVWVAPGAVNSPQSSGVSDLINVYSDLSVTTCLSNKICKGGVHCYKICLVNLGPSDAREITIQDTLSQHVKLISFKQKFGNLFTMLDPIRNCDATTIIAKAITMPAETIAVFKICICVTNNCIKCITNTVQVTSITPDPNNYNNTATTTIKLRKKKDTSIDDLTTKLCAMLR